MNARDLPGAGDYTEAQALNGGPADPGLDVDTDYGGYTIPELIAAIPGDDAGPCLRRIRDEAAATNQALLDRIDAQIRVLAEILLCDRGVHPSSMDLPRAWTEPIDG